MAEARTFLNHVAVSVPSDALDEQARAELADVYGQMFGWEEIGALAKEDRFTLRVDAEARQFLNIRSRPDHMVTSGYEHFGVVIDDEDTFDAMWATAQRIGDTHDGVVLRAPKPSSGGAGKTFRFQFRLPLAIEVMWFGDA